MLKQYPMLRYVLQKAFWYLLTFVCAVALNFALPRLGDNNPVDIIMGQAGKGLSPTEAQKKKAELLVSFGMAELDKNGNVIYEPETRRKRLNSSSPSVWPKWTKMVTLSMNRKLMQTATLSCRRFRSSTKTASRS